MVDYQFYAEFFYNSVYLSTFPPKKILWASSSDIRSETLNLICVNRLKIQQFNRVEHHIASPCLIDGIVERIFCTLTHTAVVK